VLDHLAPVLRWDQLPNPPEVLVLLQGQKPLSRHGHLPLLVSRCNTIRHQHQSNMTVSTEPGRRPRHSIVPHTASCGLSLLYSACSTPNAEGPIAFRRSRAVLARKLSPPASSTRALSAVSSLHDAALHTTEQQRAPPTARRVRSEPCRCGSRLEPNLPLSATRLGAILKCFQDSNQLTRRVNREDTGTVASALRCTPIQVGPLARNDGAIPIWQHDSEAPFRSSSLCSPCHLQRLPQQGMMWSSDRDAVHCTARVVCSL